MADRLREILDELSRGALTTDQAAQRLHALACESCESPALFQDRTHRMNFFDPGEPLIEALELVR